MTSTRYGSSKIGIIGQGMVGTALSKGLERAGYEVRTTGKEPDEVKDVAAWGDLLVLAVPYNERRNAIEEVGRHNLREKTLVDVTNALAPDYTYAGSGEESGAEQLAKWAGPDCCVVKAFNTTFARTMEQGHAHGEPLTIFCAGDDPQAKEEVIQLGKDIGFDAVDAGPLRNARFLEPMGYLNMQVAQANKPFGDEVGFRYVYRGAARRSARPSPGPAKRTEPRTRVQARTSGRGRKPARKSGKKAARVTGRSRRAH